MKNLCYFIFFFTLNFGCAFSLYSETRNYDIKFPFYEDGRKWKKGTNEESETFSLTEYILEGEANDNWSELVTTQYFKAQSDLCLETFFSNFIMQLAKNKPQNKIDSRIIENSSDKLLAEWWISEKSANDQHEWVQIFQRNRNVGILRYTTKRMNHRFTRGKVWEDILSRSHFESR